MSQTENRDPLGRWRGENPRPRPVAPPERPWRRIEGSPTKRQFRRRLLWQLGGVLVFAFFLAGLIWVSSWLRLPKGAALVLLAAGYEENLAVPHNVHGRQGHADLAEAVRGLPAASSWGLAPVSLAHEPLELRSDTPWARGLERLPGRTVILFFAAHGGADQHGPYLLPHDATLAADPKNRLRIDAILEQLAALPAEKNKILIFDATQIVAHWPLGILHNDFARGLNELDERIRAIPNLVVLSASDVDERSWVSEEWRRTIFTHALMDALRGGAADADANGRLTLEELHVHIRAQVQHWVQHNRQAVQTPVLLPLGPEGVARAQRMNVTISDPDYVSPTLAQQPVFQPAPELVEAWRTCQRWEADSPAPAVFAPQQWRLYRDWLLRLEQLERAGDRLTMARVAQRLRELDAELRTAQRPALTSLGNSLAMPAAAGWPLRERDERVTGLFETLWSASETQRSQRWADFRAANESNGTELTRFRLALQDRLMERAAENPAAHLAKAVEVLRLIEDRSRPRPAEVHFLMMLHRDGPPHADMERVRDVLLLRRRVERVGLVAPSATYAHPYAEKLVPWLRPVLETIDVERRPAEDLLFVGNSQSTAEVRRHAEKANIPLMEAQGRSTLLQTAFTVHDRALAELPYLASWLARRRWPEKMPPADVESELAGFEALCSEVQRLTELLAAPPPKTEQFAERFGDLNATATRVSSGLKTYQQKLSKYADELEDFDSPLLWRDVDDVLSIPFADADARVRLLTSQRRVSQRHLLEARSLAPTVREGLEWGGGFPSLTVGASGQSRERSDETPTEAARRQVRLALAAFGREPFDALKGTDGEAHEVVLHRVKTFQGDPQGWHSLAIAGDEIARRHQRLPAEVARLHTNNQFDQALRLSLLLDGAGVEALEVNPAQALRNQELQGLLQWKAERTLADRWFNEDPKADPYYRVAGLTYLSDALSLARGSEPLDDLQRRLKQRQELTLVVPPRLALTSERGTSLAGRIRPEEGERTPVGHIAWFAEAGKGLEVQGTSNGERRSLPLGPKQTDAEVRCKLTSPLLRELASKPPATTAAIPSELTLRGLFRGQVLEGRVPVDLYPLPDVTVFRHELPERASLAVRADRSLLDRYRAGAGSVVFVLDCSGSMGPADGQAYGPQTKIVQALLALGKVIRAVPPGTRVSLYIFGQAMGPRRRVDNAEDTIRRVFGPAPWDPNSPQLRALLEAATRVDEQGRPAFEPWNESPIVRAMLTAKDDLQQAAGFKTLIVITDGMDNRFDKDQSANPERKPISTVLAERFQGSGVSVHMVGFRFEEPERAQALEQFSIVEKLEPPGKLHDVRNTDELEAALRRALRQRLQYHVDRYDNRPVSDTSAAGLEISRSGASDRWFPGSLPPGSYRTWTLLDRLVHKNVLLQRGELLLLNLKDSGAGPHFERALYSLVDHGDKPAKTQAGWRVGVLQNQALPEQAMQMLLALEKEPSADETVLQQIHPRDLWVELAANAIAADASTFPLRWGYRAGYPAPTYDLSVPHWPSVQGTAASAPPRLRVWWNPLAATPPAATWQIETDFKIDESPRAFLIDGRRVVLESVQVEEQLVEVRPGQKELKQCLVVRIEHPPGQEVWVRPMGLATAGHEQRFYSRAGKYTGVFWPVTPESVTRELRGLEVTSLATLKREAEAHGFHVDFNQLAARLRQASDHQNPWS